MIPREGWKKIHVSHVRLHFYLAATWREVQRKGRATVDYVLQHGLEPERANLDASPIKDAQHE